HEAPGRRKRPPAEDRRILRARRAEELAPSRRSARSADAAPPPEARDRSRRRRADPNRSRRRRPRPGAPASPLRPKAEASLPASLRRARRPRKADAPSPLPRRPEHRRDRCAPARAPNHDHPPARESAREAARWYEAPPRRKRSDLRKHRADVGQPPRGQPLAPPRRAVDADRSIARRTK